MKKTLYLPLSIIILFIYMVFITVLGKWDSDSISSFAFFTITMVSILWFIQDVNDINVLYKIFYNVAVFEGVIGIIQFVAFVLGYAHLVDFSAQGFYQQFTIRHGFITALGLYTEPAHAAPLIIWAVWTFLISKEKKFKFVKKYKTAIILIFAVLTQSTVVYVSVFLIFCLYVFLYQRVFMKKVQYLVLGVCGIVLLMLIDSDFVMGALNRFKMFENVSTTTMNDLSALAIVSNLRIAIEKLKDGYIFGTGFDSHRIYYDQYIREIYGTIIMAINKNDCATLYTRIFSEFGIVGFVAFVIASAKRFFTAIKRKNLEAIILLFLFMVVIIRTGSYVNIISITAFMYAFILPIKENTEKVALISEESE
ncbi:MAG: hypothetical protein E7557_02950 [Ruminococcaceae bacterium]|nr:hypothetical protein [Oscillospiraceae bacterium]